MYNFVVPDRAVVIREQIGIWCDSQLAFTQHGKAAECNDGVGIEVNQVTAKIVHIRNEEFARWKA
jgi:hypothetical protein